VINVSGSMVVPKGLDVAKLAPVELATCVAANILDLKDFNVPIAGKTVGVMGLGPAGVYGALMLRIEGAAKIIGFDASPDRRAYALAHGIVDEVVDNRGDEGAKFPDRKSADARLDLAIDFVGHPSATEWLMDHTRSLVQLFGIQLKPFSYAGCNTGKHNGLKVFGMGERNRACSDYVVRWIRLGALDLSLAVTHRMPIEKYADAMKLLAGGTSQKVLFTFDHLYVDGY
jgi:threonine dehydrogenase-like Zn-dependent dehydrogenase